MESNVKQDKKIGVIGCGKMASAILEGILKNNFLSCENIFAYDINENLLNDFVNKNKLNKANSIEELLEKTEIILLATKPFVVEDVLNKIKNNYKNQLILSILAGVKIEKYQKIIENIKLIRIMPNTPALVNLGMSAICADKNISQNDVNFAYDFMKNCGEVIHTTEDKIDIITALSGSGPAFYFKIIELMAKSAQKLGLEYKQAILLSAQTALGSAKMVLENNFNTEQLIKNVTTPGGCTEVGNNILNNSSIDKILNETIEKTKIKASELG